MSTRSFTDRPQTSHVRMAFIACGLALLLTFASSALAGGFQLSVETPAASNDPQFKDAALVVRTFGCMRPADAKLSVTAEGLVNGKRQSLPLELKDVGTGVYTIRQQWPSEGSWVIAISGDYNGMTSSLLVELAPGGKVYADTRMVEGSRKGTHVRGSQKKWASADIESALKAMAGSTAQVTDEAAPSTSRPAAIVVAGLGALLFLAGFVTIAHRARAATARNSASGA
jgi:hypothetical protein